MMTTPVCKHCHQPIQELEIRQQVPVWMHIRLIEVEKSATVYQHCGNDVHRPVAEPVFSPTPEQRAEMRGYIERTQPGLLESLGMEEL